MGDAAIFQASTIAYTVGYALVFVLFGLFWLRVFFPGALRLKDNRLWPAMTLGALGLLLTLTIQTPAQRWVNSWGNSLGWSVWVLGGLLVLLTGVIQEGLKALGMALGKFTGDQDLSWRSVGLAVGLGFGVWEAWQLVAWPLGTSGLLSAVAVLERFSAIGLHLGAAALTAYGFSTRRPVRFAILAALIHAIGNFSVLLYQQWVINFWTTEAYIFIVGLASLWLARRMLKTVRE